MLRLKCTKLFCIRRDSVRVHKLRLLHRNLCSLWLLQEKAMFFHRLLQWVDNNMLHAHHILNINNIDWANQLCISFSISRGISRNPHAKAYFLFVHLRKLSFSSSIDNVWNCLIVNLCVYHSQKMCGKWLYLSLITACTVWI